MEEFAVLTKLVNALRQPVIDIEGTGTYPDGLFSAVISRRTDIDGIGSLRSSYEQDYLAAKKLNEAPRAHS
jgi:hypothetical protein